MLPSDGRITVAMLATARRSCALTHTSSSGVFFCTLLPDGFHRMRHFGFLANSHRRDRIGLCRQILDQPPPAGGESELGKSQHGQSKNALTAGVPCTGQGSLLRLFRRPGHHLSGTIHHELGQSAAPPMCPQNQAPRRRAIPPGPSHTERPTMCIESARIAADRPASCSRRSPDQAKIRSCHRYTRRIRYRRQSACPNISITAANNPRLTSIRLM